MFSSVFEKLSEKEAKEVASSVNYILLQIKKGWTMKEALTQAENAYGTPVFNHAKYYLLHKIEKGEL